jgi:hypothetical protein
MSAPMLHLLDPLPEEFRRFFSFDTLRPIALTTIQGTDSYEKSLLLPLLVKLLSEQKIRIDFDGAELQVKSDYLDFLNTPPKSSESLLSPSCVVLFKDNSWWLHLSTKHWLLGLRDPLKINWSPDQRAWLSAWGFLGNSASKGTPWTEVMHWEDTQFRTDDIKRLPVSWRPPEFSWKGRLLDLPAPTTIRSDLAEVLANRTSRGTVCQGVELSRITSFFSSFLSSRIPDAVSFSYPSAGGLYQTHLFLEARQVQGADPGLFYYNPLLDEWREIGVASARAGVGTILLVSCMRELCERYGALALRLALLNTGVLYQQIGLGLAAAALKGHAWGTVVEEQWAQQFQGNWQKDWKLTGAFEITGGD